MNKLAQMLGYGGLAPVDIGNALMRPAGSTQDINHQLSQIPVQRGGVFPLTTYADNSTRFDPEAGVIGALAKALTAPARAYKDGMTRDEMIDEGVNFAGTVGAGGVGASIGKRIASRPKPAPITERGYSGSYANDASAFRPSREGVWGSSNPNIASQYADVLALTDDHVPFSLANPNVAPVEFRFANPFVYDAHGAPYNNLSYGGRDWLTSDYISNMARKRGHDGVVFRNIIDNAPNDTAAMPSTVYHALRPGTAYSTITGERLFSGGVPIPSTNGRRDNGWF